MKTWLRNNGLSLAMFSLFLLFLAAQSVASCSAFAQQIGQPPRDFRAQIVRDLDGDKRIETIDVDARRASTLEVRRGKRVLWRGVQKRVRPWLLQIGDIDGDGKNEIALGTYKATRLFPIPHRTVSIYSWNGRICAPKWLGSHLSHPYQTFRLADIDGDRRAELIALETPHKQGKALREIAVYSWDYFGFRFDGRSRAHADLQLLQFVPSPRTGISGTMQVSLQGKRQLWRWPRDFPLR